MTLFDLFLAGSETTSTTLTWAVLYMVRYPGVQAGVQRELARVVGEDRWGQSWCDVSSDLTVSRLPAMGDKPQLPYTEAVVMEIQRHANIVPLGAQHITSVATLHNNGVMLSRVTCPGCGMSACGGSSSPPTPSLPPSWPRC